MALLPRHGWHLRGAGQGGPAAADVNLGISGVTFAVDRGEAWGWASAQTPALLAAGALQAGAAPGVSLAIVIGAACLCVALVATLIESLATAATPEGAAIEDILRVLAIASVPIAIALAALGGRVRAEA